MPWITIIAFVVSFLMSKKKGANNAEAALIGTAVAGAAYYTVEPTNETAIWGDTSRSLFGMDPVSADTLPTTGVQTADGSEWGSSLASFGNTVIGEAGSTLRSWGPTGTVGVIAGTAAVTGSGVFKNISPWLLIGGAVLAFVALSN
jgi:hypothetical protein